MKKTGVRPRFSFGASVSVLPYVAIGIAITVRVVPRVVQVLDVRVVSTEGIGGGGSHRNRQLWGLGGGGPRMGADLRARGRRHRRVQGGACGANTETRESE